LAVGVLAMVPRFANGIEAAAVRFQDQAGYAATVLHGTHLTDPVSLYPPTPAGVTPSSVIIALCSVLLALAALYWRRLPVLSRGYEPGRGLNVAVRRLKSGVINDYITWLVTGVAAIGAVLALIVR
jgi:multicomponent Na+:H+ antiporter subunit D